MPSKSVLLYNYVDLYAWFKVSELIVHTLLPVTTRLLPVSLRFGSLIVSFRMLLLHAVRDGV